MRLLTLILVAGLASMAAAQPEPDPQPPTPPDAAAPEPDELFPHLRLDADARLIELDGIVPIDCHNEETPVVYLEVVACAPDTKEHESLVMTRAKPSHVHAALLALGLEPGTPGSWSWDAENEEMVAHQPEGPPLHVSVAWTDARGTRRERPITDWLRREGVDREVTAAAPKAAFRFAGSKRQETDAGEMYVADRSGLIVGLTTFGSEVVAWHEVFSHDSSVQDPMWLAFNDRVPPLGTKVVLRIHAPGNGNATSDNRDPG